MKFLVLLGLIALSAGAPQPRKVFHEHVQDFFDIIEEEAGDEIGQIFGNYLEFEEFTNTMDYILTENFVYLIYELESLPEFAAVINYLEQDNIDIKYFIEEFNAMLERIHEVKRARYELSMRQTLSGTDFSSFIKDCISEFPTVKLAALFDEKKAEDEEFKSAVENLESEEWKQVLGALWENETFQKEVEVLEAQGIYLEVLLDELLAIFGQKMFEP